MGLRNIIKKSIKQFINEQANPGVMHVYRGCNLGGMNTGVGNTSGNPPYDGFIPNQLTGGNYSDPNLQTSPPATLDDALINNSNIIHGYWNNPSQGQVIKVVTCNPNSQTCNPTCLEYLGPETSFSNGNYQPTAYGGNSNLTQHLGTYASCSDCDGGNTLPIDGCTDSNAINYNPSAINDDGSCDYGYRCGEKRIKPRLSLNKCVPGTQQNPGQFETLQDCIESDCETKRAERDPIDDFEVLSPVGPVINPQRDRIKKALKEIAQPTCLMVSAKSCLGGTISNTDPSKCATLDGTPVSLMDMHKVIKFSNDPNPYRISGMSFNATGSGTDDMTSVNDACGCDPSAGFAGNFNWSNWVDNWTNNNAFQNINNNPNQPCNHICQRKQLWSGQIPNVGPLWANSLYCKLETVEQQIQIHGCGC